jgi:hypothetical protein
LLRQRKVTKRKAPQLCLVSFVSLNFLKIQLHKGGKEGNITFPRIKCGEIFRYFSIEKTFKKCDFLCDRTFPE